MSGCSGHLLHFSSIPASQTPPTGSGSCGNARVQGCLSLITDSSKPHLCCFQFHDHLLVNCPSLKKKQMIYRNTDRKDNMGRWAYCKDRQAQLKKGRLKHKHRNRFTDRHRQKDRKQDIRKKDIYKERSTPMDRQTTDRQAGRETSHTHKASQADAFQTKIQHTYIIISKKTQITHTTCAHNHT